MKTLLKILKKGIGLPIQVSFKRFLLPTLIALSLGVTLVIQLELELGWLNDVNASLFFGFPIALLLVFLKERRLLVKFSTPLMFVIPVMFMVMMFVYLRLEPLNFIKMSRYVNVLYASYIVVLFIPFITELEQLSIGIIHVITKLTTAFFFSLVLYVGIVVILVSMNVLFSLAIQFTLYAQILAIIATFVFLPTWLSLLPEPTYQLSLKPDYHPIWQKVFQSILVPLMSVFSLLIILYLLTGFFQSQQYNVQIYTFSALVIAFVGISTQVALEPLDHKKGLTHWYAKYFHFALLLVMVGYYIELIRLVIDFSFSLSFWIQVILGLWPIVYGVSKVVKPREATRYGLLALVAVYVWMAILPFANAISLTSFSLHQQLKVSLQAFDMLSDTNQIVAKETLSEREYNKLRSIVDNMSRFGFDRFPLIPESYTHPGDFQSLFGYYEAGVDPVEGFSLSFSLSADIIDLSMLEAQHLYFIPSIRSLLDGFSDDKVTMLLYEEDHPSIAASLHVDYANVQFEIDLIEEIGVVLEDRFESQEATSPSLLDLGVSFIKDDVEIMIWVRNFYLYEGRFFKNFEMSFYLGLL